MRIRSASYEWLNVCVFILFWAVLYMFFDTSWLIIIVWECVTTKPILCGQAHPLDKTQKLAAYTKIHFIMFILLWPYYLHMPVLYWNVCVHNVYSQVKVKYKLAIDPNFVFKLNKANRLQIGNRPNAIYLWVRKMDLFRLS